MVLIRVGLSFLGCLWLMAISGCESVPHKRVVPVSNEIYTAAPPSKARVPKANELQGPDTPSVVFELTDKAVAAMNVEQWRASQRMLEQAVRIAPNEAQVYLVYGDFYQRQDDFLQARQMFLRAMSLAGERSRLGKLALARLKNLPK